MANGKKRLTAIQAWMETESGQDFLNKAYSWGAAIVILGALFKLTHIAGANFMLFLGMGTEVIVFFISGFERQWRYGDEKSNFADEGGEVEVETVPDVVQATRPVAQAAVAAAAMPAGAGSNAASGPVDAAALAANFSQLAEAQKMPASPDMAEATQAYVDQLRELTSTLKQVADQSARLTRDSEEMENMNRTLTGINRFYEMQLRSVGQQSATIDDVNTQSKRLAEQLQELNEVYSRMIEALKLKIG